MADQQREIPGIKQAGETYRELCIPFASPELANESLQKFQEELYDLRCKYRIRDLLFVCVVPIKYEDGEEGTPVVVGHYGNEAHAESMAHHAAGRTSADRQERIAKTSARAARAVRPAKNRQ